MVEKRIAPVDEPVDPRKTTKATEESSALVMNPEDLALAALDLQFEDAYEDIEVEGEMDADEVVIDARSDAESDVNVLDNEVEEERETYLPGQALAANEVLVPDNSAYECLHSFTGEWPCLSFDTLADDLGQARSIVSHKSCLVDQSSLTLRTLLLAPKHRHPLTTGYTS